MVGMDFAKTAMAAYKRAGVLATATLRRRHTASDRDAGLVTGALALSGAHAQGATALTLRQADSGPAAGFLPAGLELTIDAVSYIIANKVTASDGVYVVTVTPGLATVRSDGDAVTLTGTVSWSFPNAHITNVDLSALPMGDALPTFNVQLLRLSSPTGVTPRKGDWVTATDSFQTVIGDVLNVNTRHLGWDVSA